MRSVKACVALWSRRLRLPRPRHGLALWLFLSPALIAPGAPGKGIIDFDRDPTGALPADWESAMTKTGGAPDWQILRDETARSKPNVLAQMSTDRTAGRFPIAVYRRASFKDGELSVRFKPVSGTVDQA